MQYFSLEKRLPSCKVDRDLLVRLEAYMLEQAEHAFGLTGEDRSLFSITMKDSFGTESVSSTTELRGEKFADTTSSISLALGARGRNVRLTVRFNRDADLSEASAEIGGTNARKKAIGSVCWNPASPVGGFFTGDS